MKLLVDCRYVRVGHHDGISRFTAGIVSELGKRVPLTMLIHDPRQLEQLPTLPSVVGPSPTSVLEPFVARRINRLGFDTVFSPMQTMGSWGRRYRLALTVHDLIYYSHSTPPRNLPGIVRLAWRLYHRAWWPQRLLLNGADTIVTVSETTRGLIAKHHLTRRPIVVVPNAADPLPGVPRLPRTPPRRTNYVYMGSFMAYKNVECLVRAVHELPHATLHLLSRISDADRTRLEALAPSGQLVIHNGVTESEYAALLDGATALVSASSDEGFGIPVVEAGSRGTPVVVSDIPIFHEVAGESGVFFEAASTESLVSALRQLDNAAEWRRRSAAALHNAERYSWAASAEALLSALEDLHA